MRLALHQLRVDLYLSRMRSECRKRENLGFVKHYKKLKKNDVLYTMKAFDINFGSIRLINFTFFGQISFFLDKLIRNNEQRFMVQT